MNDESGDTLRGTLHIFVAFDWGEEIDLERAGKLAAGEAHALARRSRTPASLVYQPAPWRFRLAPTELELGELGRIEAAAEATLFDLGAVSVGLHVPFVLPLPAIQRLAGSLANSAPIVEAVRQALLPLHAKVLPAIKEPESSQLSEEYFVFHFTPGEAAAPLVNRPERMLTEQAVWAAGVLRLENEPLSLNEVAEATRLHISYTPHDLFVPEWSAALLVDHNCEETLQTIEYANLQLLEYRHIDNRLDERLAGAYKLIHPLKRSWLPFWRMHGRQLRDLGELRIEMHDVFERTGNVLKLVGDQYLARCYQLLAARFHLDEWEENIERALEVVEGAYQVVSDQSATIRTEVLEIIVIVLIAMEIIMAFVGH